MKRKTDVMRLIPYWIVIWPFWIYFKYICRGVIKNEQIINDLKDTGFIIAANHVSYFDWIVLHIYFLLKHNMKITFFAKTKVLDHPVWGKMVIGGRCIAVDRNLIVNNAINRNLLAGSKHFVIFPEGTRSTTGELLRGKYGVIKIAHATGLPVIPTALIGFYQLWPRHRWLPGINRLRILFGEPIFIENDNMEKTSIEELTRNIMQRIAQMLGKTYDQ